MVLVSKQWRRELWLHWNECCDRADGVISANASANASVNANGAAGTIVRDYYERVCSGALVHSPLNAIKHRACVFINWSSTPLHDVEPAVQQAIAYCNLYALRQIVHAIALAPRIKTMADDILQTRACVLSRPIGLANPTALMQLVDNPLPYTHRALAFGVVVFGMNTSHGHRALIVGGWPGAYEVLSARKFEWINIVLDCHSPAEVVNALDAVYPTTIRRIARSGAFARPMDAYMRELDAFVRHQRPAFENAAALWEAWCYIAPDCIAAHAFWAPVIQYTRALVACVDFATLRVLTRTAYHARPDLTSAIKQFAKLVRGYIHWRASSDYALRNVPRHARTRHRLYVWLADM